MTLRGERFTHGGLTRGELWAGGAGPDKSMPAPAGGFPQALVYLRLRRRQRRDHAHQQQIAPHNGAESATTPPPCARTRARSPDSSTLRIAKAHNSLTVRATAHTNRESPRPIGQNHLHLPHCARDRAHDRQIDPSHPSAAHTTAPPGARPRTPTGIISTWTVRIGANSPFVCALTHLDWG